LAPADGDRAFVPSRWESGQRVESSTYRALSRERKRPMFDFMQNIWFMILMGVLLVGLIILFIYLRNHRPED
jgi:hypothetical protein